MIIDAQKYSIRLEEDKDEKTKREFINAVSNPSAGSSTELKEIVQAMKLNNETINAIATSLKYGNKPPEKAAVSNVGQMDHFKNLSDAITKIIQ